jgi:hypothetical protein
MEWRETAGGEAGVTGEGRAAVDARQFRGEGVSHSSHETPRNPHKVNDNINLGIDTQSRAAFRHQFDPL